MKRIILVTGASSGIGLEVAKYLSSKGHTVYGGSRSAPHSEFFHSIHLDVTSDDSVKETLKQIIDQEGRIDVLINNAGVGSVGSVEKTPIGDIHKSFEVNFYGVIRMMQAVLPHMRKHGFGRIINMSTLGSMIGLPYRGFYSSSKGAMDLVSETLRLEVERFGISSCTIHPGEVRTKIAEHRIVSANRNDEVYGKVLKKVFDKLDASVEHGKDPAFFGPFIEKIIESKKIKRNYYIGNTSELIGIQLKKFLPYNLYEAILRKYFASDD